MARHGTRRSSKDGCRCEDCKDAQRLYQQRYRERRQTRAEPERRDGFRHASERLDSTGRSQSEPGPVESGVRAELEGLTEARPGLAQVALALARLLDNPRATSQKAAAAKVLATLLDRLATASAGGRQSRLSLVKSMTTSSPSA